MENEKNLYFTRIFLMRGKKQIIVKQRSATPKEKFRNCGSYF